MSIKSKLNRVDTSNAVGGSTGTLDWSLRLLCALAAAMLLGSVVYATTAADQTALTPMSFDGPVYDSVESLSRSAGIVVEVEVSGVVERLVDYGSDKLVDVDPADGEVVTPDGLAIAMYEAEVTNGLTGDLRVGQKILVPLLDEKVIDSEHVVTLNKGERYLLFVSRVSADKVRSINTGGRDIYVPLNYNNGVLATSGDSVQLNHWTYALTDIEAMKTIDGIAKVQVEKGQEAAEAERAAVTDVKVDRKAVLDIVTASR